MDNQNTNKTHCIRGHEFDELNTIITNVGKRKCKSCNAARAKAKRATARGTILSFEEIFWSKVDKTLGFGRDGDCWAWVGYLRRSGYGQAHARYSYTRSAHRIAFALINGLITKDQLLLHSCDNPSCVNPSHLRIGTQAENINDMVTRGRYVGNGYKDRTHCIHGHEFTSQNTYMSRVGKRQCRTCASAQSKARKFIKSQNRNQLFLTPTNS